MDGGHVMLTLWDFNPELSQSSLNFVNSGFLSVVRSTDLDVLIVRQVLQKDLVVLVKLVRVVLQLSKHLDIPISEAHAPFYVSISLLLVVLLLLIRLLHEVEEAGRQLLLSCTITPGFTRHSDASDFGSGHEEQRED